MNYYIDRLLAEPHLHDKVEFEIIFSCYTLDLPKRLGVLANTDSRRRTLPNFPAPCGVSPIASFTARPRFGGATARRSIFWRERLPTICDAEIDKISRIYWLIEDCKRYGTLPFAGLARAGFIAVQLLQSFVEAGVLNAEEAATFMASVDTVGSRIGQDFAQLSKADFLARYGHLRPGTYDILSPRYDEAPDLYFDWSSARPAASARPRFALSIEQLRRHRTAAQAA